MMSAAFWLLHESLAREAPGSEASTRNAIQRLPPLPAAPQVLDVGCGPGAQTLVLADTLRTRVAAIDIHQPFLDRLEKSAAERGLAELIETRNLSMDVLDYPPESIDLIWCEGGIYLLGVPAALRLWRPMLRRGGVVAFTECTWLTAQRPAEAAAFWSDSYPAMTTVAANTEAAEREGYEVTATFPLPAHDWWAEYYTPLQERIDQLRTRDEPDLRAVLDETQREIDLYARHGDSYGYVFYVACKVDRPGGDRASFIGM